MDAPARRLRAQIAAHASWANRDPKTEMAKRRADRLENLRREVTEEAAQRGETLTEEEKTRRAISLRRARNYQMSLRSKQIRDERKTA
jgi:hypothetical protein